MIRFKLILFFCCTIFTAYKTKYATKEFKVSQIPLSPNYNSLESWAAHPEKNDSIIDVFYTTEKENLKADVFYIYPTLLTSKKNDAWNSDVFDDKQNNIVKNSFKPSVKSFPKDIPINNIEKRDFKCIAKKIRPSEEEVKKNIRSRSAIMRVFQKIC